MDGITARPWCLNETVDAGAILLDVCERAIEHGRLAWSEERDAAERPQDTHYRSAVALASYEEAVRIIGDAGLLRLSEGVVELARMSQAEDRRYESIVSHPAMRCTSRATRESLSRTTAAAAALHAELRARMLRDASLESDGPSVETKACAAGLVADLLDALDPRTVAIEDLEAWGIPVRLDARPVQVAKAVLKDAVVACAGEQPIGMAALDDVVRFAAAAWIAANPIGSARIKARLSTLVQIYGRSGK